MPLIQSIDFAAWMVLSFCLGAIVAVFARKPRIWGHLIKSIQSDLAGSRRAPQRMETPASENVRNEFSGLLESQRPNEAIDSNLASFELVAWMFEHPITPPAEQALRMLCRGDEDKVQHYLSEALKLHSEAKSNYPWRVAQFLCVEDYLVEGIRRAKP